MIDQLPKQGGGQLPPFRGALTPRHPRQRTFPTHAAASVLAPHHLGRRNESWTAARAALVTSKVTSPSRRPCPAAPPAPIRRPQTRPLPPHPTTTPSRCAAVGISKVSYFDRPRPALDGSPLSHRYLGGYAPSYLAHRQRAAPIAPFHSIIPENAPAALVVSLLMVRW
jgi:hypothetical protein